MYSQNIRGWIVEQFLFIILLQKFSLVLLKPYMSVFG